MWRNGTRQRLQRVQQRGAHPMNVFSGEWRVVEAAAGRQTARCALWRWRQGGSSLSPCAVPFPVFPLRFFRFQTIEWHRGRLCAWFGAVAVPAMASNPSIKALRSVCGSGRPFRGGIVAVSAAPPRHSGHQRNACNELHTVVPAVRRSAGRGSRCDPWKAGSRLCSLRPLHSLLFLSSCFPLTAQ